MSFYKWFNNHIRESNKKWMNSGSSSSSYSSSCRQCCDNCKWLSRFSWYNGNYGAYPLCNYHDVHLSDDLKNQTCRNFENV